VALELKSSDKSSITKLQEYVLTEVTNAKGIACVATPSNWPAIRERLNRIAEGDPKLWQQE